MAIKKQEAKSPDEILSIITKEQEFLSGLHGNIKYPENHPQELIDKCEVAHKQVDSDILSNLKDIANQALTSGAKSKEELVSDLQASDLKEVYTKLDQNVESHHINSTLTGFKDAKLEARTLDDILPIISSEQEFLISLYDNIKYPEQHSDTLLEVKCAYSQKDENLLEELKEVSSRALSTGTKTQQDLIKELSQTSNVGSICDNLSWNIDAHLVSNAVNLLNKDNRVISNFEKRGEEAEITKFLTSRMPEYEKLRSCLENKKEYIELERMNQRLKISEIYQNHKKTEYGASKYFKDETLLTFRLSKEGVESVLDKYNDKGIDSAATFAREKNVKLVADLAFKKSDILLSNSNNTGKTYIELIAKNNSTMNYIDEALQKTDELNINKEQKVSLLEYSNHRYIDREIQNIDNYRDKQTFNSNIEDLRKFTNTEELSKGLAVLQEKGLKGLSEHTADICTSRVSKAIEDDLLNIRRNRPTELLGRSYDTKKEYFTALSKDDDIIKYIETAIPQCKDNDLKTHMIECCNERNIRLAEERYKQDRSEYKTFNSNIEDLRKFTNTEELSKGLAVLQEKGLKGLSEHTADICTSRVSKAIEDDLLNIRRNRPTELLGRSYDTKKEYFTALSKDDNIIKYVQPNSDISKEIEEQLNQQKANDKGFDFER